MIHEINLSQVLAMIAVSGSVKQIKIGNGGVYHNKTNLLKIDPNKVYGEKVRCEGMWSYANGGSTK